jgi:Flp pilus assembly protein TadB
METTRTKPMGPQPGQPGDFRKSPWFWRMFSLALAVLAGGVVLGMWNGQAGSVLVGTGIFLMGVALAFAAMTSLRSRDRDDEKLREAP